MTSALELFSSLSIRSSLFAQTPQIVLISDRLHTMQLPTADGKNEVSGLAHSLKAAYGEHFMVWNLSEKSYDYDLFDNQVLEFKFPGHPCPPLHILIQLIKSVRSWLTADATNIAIVHCATGHVRTATVVACYMAFTGLCPDVHTALAHYYKVLGIAPATVTLPSQLRYVDYFAQVMAGLDPKDRPVQLQCIVVNDLPKASELPPVIQIFQQGTLIFSSVKTAPEPLGDGSFSFPVNYSMTGDVLIRCRQPGQVDPKGKRAVHSLFRINLHTAFVDSELMRLTKSELDGPHKQPSWPDSMFVDLVFALDQSSTSPPGPASTATSVWQIAQRQQAGMKNAEDLLREYEPYEPYKSGRNSIASEDGIENEIASATLDGEGNGISNEELMEMEGDVAGQDAGSRRANASCWKRVEEPTAPATQSAAGSSEAESRPSDPPVEATSPASDSQQEGEPAQAADGVKGAQACTEAEASLLEAEITAQSQSPGDLEAEISAALVSGDGGELDIDGELGLLEGELADVLADGEQLSLDDDDEWMKELEAELDQSA